MAFGVVARERPELVTPLHTTHPLRDPDLGRSHLRVVLVLAAVLGLVQVLSLLLGVVLGLLTVYEVEALGLEELVDLSSGNTGEDLLSEGVVYGLACVRTDVLVGSPSVNIFMLHDVAYVRTT